jgi:hypothetical protein
MKDRVIALSQHFHNPDKVEAKVYAKDKWLSFESTLSKTDKDGTFNHARLQCMILLSDHCVLFQLRHAVEQLIKAYMEE